MIINNDGFTDIVMGGNEYNFIPQMQRLDASFGDVLINNGKGNFTWMKPSESGIEIEGEVKDIKQIKVKNKNCLLFLRNNEYPVLYEVK